MIRKIIIAVIALAIIGVCTGVYMWYKPHPKAEDQASISITAENLTKAFTADEQKANTVYLDKVIEVSGTVSDVNKFDGKVFVILESGDPMAEVQCTLRDAGATAEKGERVLITGFCRGNNMGVILTECVIKKQ